MEDPVLQVRFKRILYSLLVVFCITTSCFNEARSQDIQFSQFYAAALYLNPAFAGSTHTHRAMFHQRLQWPRLEAKYITSLFSFDTYFPGSKSGIGLMAIKDFQGRNYINSTEIVLQYSYELGITKKLAFRPGLQAGYITRTIDYTHMRFPDQHNVDQGYTGQSTLDPTVSGRRASMFDIGAGGMFYSKKFWFSYAGHHLNTPNQSFGDGTVSILPAKHSFTAGYKFAVLKGETKPHMGHHDDQLYLVPTIHYKMQGKSDQFDTGIYLLYNEFVAGGWYRGIPLKKYNRELRNNESVVAILGVKLREWRVSYSYDFTISKLHDARTGGSHELNITYLFKKSEKHKPMKVLPCPTSKL
ncbi:MAG: type IX secretion system membrane protein PorP/SprF [Cytophagaceae bacterium]